MEDGILCVICRDSIQTSTARYVLPCCHIFHHDCLTDAIRHNLVKCALCRTSIPEQVLKELVPENNDFEEERGWFHARAMRSAGRLNSMRERLRRVHNDRELHQAVDALRAGDESLINNIISSFN